MSSIPGSMRFCWLPALSTWGRKDKPYQTYTFEIDLEDWNDLPRYLQKYRVMCSSKGTSASNYTHPQRTTNKPGRAHLPFLKIWALISLYSLPSSYIAKWKRQNARNKDEYGPSKPSINLHITIIWPFTFLFYYFSDYIGFTRLRECAYNYTKLLNPQVYPISFLIMPNIPGILLCLYCTIHSC